LFALAAREVANAGVHVGLHQIPLDCWRRFKLDLQLERLVLTTPERKTHTSHEKKVHSPQKKANLPSADVVDLLISSVVRGQRENVEGSLFIVW
jgi:hypothetical protein